MRHFLWPTIIYLLIWGGALAYAVGVAEMDPTGPLVALGIFGIGLPLVVHFLMIGTAPFPTTEEVSWLEPIALALLVLLAAVFFVIGSELPRTLAEVVAPGSESARLVFAALVNIVFYVVLPFVFMSVLIRHPISSFGWQSPFWRMFNPRHIVVLVVLGGGMAAVQFFGTPIGMNLRVGNYSQEQLLVALPLVYIWLVLAGGLAHAFFFRGVLQERIAMLTGNAWAGMYLAALIGALIQVPAQIIHQSGGVLTPGQIIASAILTGSVTGITFGYVWMRTRNLLLLMLLYGAVSLIVSFEDVAGAFGLI